MKRSMYLVSLLGLSLFVGSACTRKEAARENVREERREAQEAQQEANEEAREARQAERQAAQVPQDNAPEVVRQPVAGREPIVVLEETVRGELSNDWTVTRTTDMVTVTRKAQQQPPRALAQKVNDQIRSLRDDHKGLTAELPRRGEITLRGNIATCEDAADVIEDFAKIEGINQINAKVSCLGK